MTENIDRTNSYHIEDLIRDGKVEGYSGKYEKGIELLTEALDVCKALNAEERVIRDENGRTVWNVNCAKRKIYYALYWLYKALGETEKAEDSLKFALSSDVAAIEDSIAGFSLIVDIWHK